MLRCAFSVVQKIWMLNKLFQAASGLTLGELETLTSFLLTELLTLNHTRVARGQTFCSQYSFPLRVDFNQCLADSQTQSLCLTGDSTAIKVCFEIVFAIRFSHFERLVYFVLQYQGWEILF